MFQACFIVSVPHAINGKVYADKLVTLDDTIYQTKEDLEIVRRLMKDYMENPRSIIL